MTATTAPALVTGGAGFIGSALVAALRADHIPVTVLDQVPWPDADRLRPRHGDPDLHYHQVPVDDPDRLRPLVTGHPMIYHLAANTENRGDRAGRFADLTTTVGGTVALLESLVGQPPPTLVLTSSQLVYAPATEPVTERTGAIRPASRFAAGKVAAEAFLNAYTEELGLNAAVCRLSNIVGPTMRRGILPDLATRLAAKPAQLTLLGDGQQTRSYLHIEDCVRALRTAATTKGFTLFNVCNTDAISASAVAEIVVEEFPHGTPPIVTAGGAQGWAGDVPTLTVWPEALLGLGWRPVRTSAEAIRCVVRDLFQRGSDDRNE